MSASDQIPHASANFTAIFDVAIAEYHRVTGMRLDTHPFAVELDTCHSPEEISDLLRMQAQAFSEFHKRVEKLMAWLDPTIHILFTFSATLGEGIGLPFSPAKTIFTGIGVLLGAVRDVVASHETLIELFERVHFFLQRLKRYSGMPLTNDVTELLGKIMAQILSILSISTKVMAGSRIKKFLKRLGGRKVVEDALAKLDSLTKEECLMAVVRNLEVTHRVDNIVNNVAGDAKATKAIVEDIDDDVKATKELIRDVDGDVQATKALTESICDNVRVVDHNLKATKHITHELKWNQLRRELRNWLSPPDPSINHNTARETQHPGTAMWFIQSSTFREWKENGSVLWIRGNPGAGKTILCSAIIEDIKAMGASTEALIAYYYFDFKDASKRDIHGLLASLLFQLSDDSDRCRGVLHDLYTKCRDGSEKPSNAALTECLKTMLEFPGQVPVFVILDALDECPSTTGTPSDREKVLNFVENLVEANHSNLFLCITSRPEQDIQTVLNSLTSASYRVSLHNEGGQREDIKSFVRSFVHGDRNMRRWREEDRELVINVLSERANGMFRWAFCQLDTLRRCMPSSIRKALNELPTTLDETYERALQEIPKEKWEHAHRLFQCMIVAFRPLQVEELAEIFAIEFDTDAAPNLMEGWRPGNSEEAVLSACSTLITTTHGDGPKVVQFSHFSVREFLTSDRLRTSDVGNIRRYHSPLDLAHTILARACLVVLLQVGKTVGGNPLPLALYAHRCWVYHATFDSVESRIEDLIERLFDPNKAHVAVWKSIYPPGWPFFPPLDHQMPTLLYCAAFYGFSGLTRYLITTHKEGVNTTCGYLWTPLHVASEMGYYDIARVLLDHNADVNFRDQSNATSLHFAASAGQARVAELLLEHGADANARDDKKLTPLHDASQNGDLEVMKLLVKHGADINASDDRKSMPLHRALLSAHLKAAKFLIEHGADVNAKDENWTPLHWASYHGNLEMTILLIEHGADVNVPEDKDWTPLHRALHDGHPEMVEFPVRRTTAVGAKYEYDTNRTSLPSHHGIPEIVKLLVERGADVNARGYKNSTPLHWVSYHGTLELANLLIERGADVNAREDENWTPLHRASSRGDLEMVKLLIEHGADVNAREDENWMPLHTAAYHGDLEIVKLLVGHGADINARNDENWTPLHRASYGGHLEIVKFLVEHGADINAGEDENLMSLHRALYDGDLEVVKFLIEHGANVNSKEEDWTPLHSASYRGDLEVVKVLVEHGADINAREGENWTPLHSASLHGHLEVIEYLLEHDADVNAQSRSGDTPLNIASRKGYLSVVQLLLGHGAAFTSFWSPYQAARSKLRNWF